MWDPQYLTTLEASNTCFRDNFILLYFFYFVLQADLQIPKYLLTILGTFYHVVGPFTQI
jgi:hypothetical protein